MSNKFCYFLLAFIFIGIITSCKKGDEDPGISFRTRTQRLSGEWTVSSIEEYSKSTQKFEDNPNIDGENTEILNTLSITFDGTAYKYTEETKYTYDGYGYDGLSLIVSTKTIEKDELTEKTVSTSNNGIIENKKTGSSNIDLSYKYVFKEDGTFSFKKVTSKNETLNDTKTGYTIKTTNINTEDIEYTGTWSFLGANNKQNYSDKERIGLWYKNINGVRSNSISDDYTDTNSSDNIDYNASDVSTLYSYNLNNINNNYSPDEVWELKMLKNKEMNVYRSFSSQSRDTSEVSITINSINTIKEIPYNYTELGNTKMTLTQE